MGNLKISYKMVNEIGYDAMLTGGNEKIKPGIRTRSSNTTKYGLLAHDGSWVIEPMFDWAKSFKDGTIGVKINDRYGLIDSDGQWILKCGYTDIIGNDILYVEFDYRDTNQCGYLDKKGNWLIPPGVLNCGKGFLEGLAAVKPEGCKYYGYINTDGKWSIYPEFDSAGYFRHGVAIVKKSGKFGLIDRSGKWIVEPVCESSDDIDIINDGVYCVKIKQKYGFKNINGEWTTPLILDSIKKVDEKSDCNYIITCIDGQIGVLNPGKEYDKEGYWIIKPLMADVIKEEQNFHNDYFQVKFEEKWGYVDKDGEWVIEPKFENTEDFIDGVAIVRIDGAYGCINIFGEWIMGPTLSYFSINREKDMPVAIKSKDKWGLISADGDWTLHPFFSSIKLIYPGLLKVKQKENFGIVDYNGQYILKCAFEEIFGPVNGKICANSNNYSYIFNLNGEMLGKMPYKIKRVLNSGVVAYGDTCSVLVDSTGKEIIEFKGYIVDTQDDIIMIKDQNTHKIGCFDALNVKWISKQIYDNVEDFKHGVAITTMRNCK